MVGKSPIQREWLAFRRAAGINLMDKLRQLQKRTMP
jgi:hypothetical protein